MNVKKIEKRNSKESRGMIQLKDIKNRKLVSCILLCTYRGSHMKNRKGFTLIEMMLTIGIVVILASALTTNVTQFIAGADGAGNAAESQSNKYDAAQSEAKGLGGVTVAATTTLATTTAVGATTTAAAGTTTTAAAVTTTTAAAVTTTTAAAVTTTTAPAVTTTTSPAVTTTTAAASSTAATSASGYPGTTMTVKPITWNGEYNYEVDFGIPTHTTTQKVTFSLPKGTEVKLGWGVSSFKSTENGGKIVFTIDAYQSNIGVYFSYNGTEVFNPVITSIA